MVLITDADNGITRLEYDARDNLIRFTDPEGRVTAFTCKGNDQVTSETRTPASGVENIRHFAYDAHQNLCEEITPNGQKLVYGYDKADRQLCG